MMILNAKSFTSLSSSIVSMRQNVIAIRKTVANNNKNNQKIEKKEILQQRRLDETEERRAKESANEQTKEAKKGLGKLGDKLLKKPEMAFRIPGISILTATISFISFGFIGWMLKALPVIQKAVESFVEKAKEFIKSLEVFWNVIKSGFALLFNAVEGVVRQLGFGGTEGLQGGDEQKTKTLINDLVQSLNTLKDELPVRFKKFAEDLAMMFAKQQAGQDVTDTMTGSDIKLSGDAVNKTKQLLRDSEGYRSEPYWDVNAWRIGYGSDTQTDAQGRVTRVTQNSRETREGAERDLQRRIRQEFMPSAAASVGETFGKLPTSAQAALTSITYNYGTLPRNVAIAAKTGDTAAIADAVEKLKGHNAGINARRRQEEADIIRGSAQISRVITPAEITSDPVSKSDRVSDALNTGPKQISIDREVLVPITLPKERREKYQQSFAAASSIKIEVVSVDGHTFEDEIF